jgi:hypothetical protein
VRGDSPRRRPDTLPQLLIRTRNAANPTLIQPYLCRSCLRLVRDTICPFYIVSSFTLRPNTNHEDIYDENLS